jgi:hypothetical protein
MVDYRAFPSWPGFVPAIYVFLAEPPTKTWMPATSAGMTGMRDTMQSERIMR